MLKIVVQETIQPGENNAPGILNFAARNTLIFRSLPLRIMENTGNSIPVYVRTTAEDLRNPPAVITV